MDSTFLGWHSCLEIPKLPLYPQNQPKIHRQEPKGCTASRCALGNRSSKRGTSIPGYGIANWRCPNGVSEVPKPHIRGAQTIYCGCDPPPSNPPPNSAAIRPGPAQPGDSPGSRSKVGLRPPRSEQRPGSNLGCRAIQKPPLSDGPAARASHPIFSWYLLRFLFQQPRCSAWPRVPRAAPERGCQEPQPRANEVLVAGK